VTDRVRAKAGDVVLEEAAAVGEAEAADRRRNTSGAHAGP